MAYDKDANVMDIEEYLAQPITMKQEDNYEVISVTAAPFDVKEEVKDKLEVLSNELTDDELKYAIIALSKNLEAREKDNEFLDNIVHAGDLAYAPVSVPAKQFDDEGAQFDDNAGSY
jgi:hypothetical protein